MFRFGNLTIRLVESGDFPFLIDIKSSSWQFLGNIGMLSLPSQKEWLQTVNKDRSKNYYILFNEKGFKIGLVRMDEIDFINSSVRVGGDIHVRFKGKGYGQKMMGLVKKYCFDYLNMNRLWLLVLETNKVALHIYDKSGFVKEGVQRKAIFRNGKYIDYIMMSLLKSEYQEKLGITE